MTDREGLAPLDPESRLVRFHFDHGDHIAVYVLIPGEALDASHRLSEQGAAALPGYTPDKPDEMHVAPDGRPIAVYYSNAARQQLAGDS
jgi:hypothetical protein